MKLAPCFFDLFESFRWFVPIASELELPMDSHFHPVFHLSLIVKQSKSAIGALNTVATGRRRILHLTCVNSYTSRRMSYIKIFVSLTLRRVDF